MRTGDEFLRLGPGSLLVLAAAALDGERDERFAAWRGGELFAPEGRSPAPPEPDEAAVAAAQERLRHFSLELYRLCLLASMSAEGLEALVLDAAAEAGRAGPEVLLDHGRPGIHLLHRDCDRVEREFHRLAGLARFVARPDGLYSAALEPEHRVLPALAAHFLDRFGDRSFALVDARRAEGILALRRQLVFLEGTDALALLPAEDRGDAASLWRRYFAAIENPQRRNPELQRHFMPRRYWKYLVELQDGTHSANRAASKRGIPLDGCETDC